MISAKNFFVPFCILVSFLLTGCETTSSLVNPYSTDIDEFYRVIKQSYEIPEECKLKEGEDPKIYYSRSGISLKDYYRYINNVIIGEKGIFIEGKHIYF